VGKRGEGVVSSEGVEGEGMVGGCERGREVLAREYWMVTEQKVG
jgi:hypothetical protein